MIGGGIVQAWNAAYPAAGAVRAGRLAGRVHGGRPAGLLLAAWGIDLARAGARRGRRSPHPALRARSRASLAELFAVIPPFSMLALRRLGASRAARARATLRCWLACVVGAVLLVPRHRRDAARPRKRAVIVDGGRRRQSPPTWCNGAQSRSASMRRRAGSSPSLLRDRWTARLLAGTPSFIALAVGGGLLSFGQLCAERLHLPLRQDLSRAVGERRLHPRCDLGGRRRRGDDAGRGDRRCLAQEWDPAGRVHVAIAAAILSGGCSPAGNIARRWSAIFYIACFLGSAVSDDVARPGGWRAGRIWCCRGMRGTATALQFLGVNLIGLGLGPDMVGLVSDVTGDLRLAMLLGARADPGDGGAVAFAARRLPEAEANAARPRPRRRRGDLTSVIAGCAHPEPVEACSERLPWQAVEGGAATRLRQAQPERIGTIASAAWRY